MEMEEVVEDAAHGIVIVGGGICGLATALALHRYTHLFSHSTISPPSIDLTVQTSRSSFCGFVHASRRYRRRCSS
jgi:thioredoxin reductase